MKNKIRTGSNLVDGIRETFDKYPEFITFLIVSATVLWLNLYQDNHVFYYDSEQYWNLRLEFDQQHSVDFSLLNFNVSLRGYLLPFIFYIISKSASVIGLSDVTFLEIIQALIFSGLITIIIPRVIKMLYNKPFDFWQIITFSLLAVFFWQGYFYYPLSDLWALFFFIIGVYAFLRQHTSSWVLLFVGVCWGGAFLIRPSYVISIIILIFWTIYYYKYLNLKVSQFAFKVFMIIFGLIGISLPQLMINITHFDKFSPMPQSQLDLGGNLFMKQLSWGIEIQRYETFVGTQSDYPSPRMIFADPHGANILIRSGIGPFSPGNSDSFLTLREYISLVVRHPLDFFVLYFRHLFNGLDVVYNTPYIYNLYRSIMYVRIINYSLWFLIVLFISSRLKTSIVLNRQFLLLSIFALPSILSIPTAIEIRFMLPFYFIAYAIFAFDILPRFWSCPQKKQISLILQYIPWYIAFISICLTLSLNTFLNMQYGTYIFW